MALPPQFDQLSLPVIAAPMTDVSGPDLVIACSLAGVVGSFPAHNARSTSELGQWIERISIALASRPGAAPFAVNLVVHPSNERLHEDLACLAEYQPPIVITSVGSPAAALDRLRGWDCTILSDVASMRHVERALGVGVDGLVLLCSGAGGQTGSASPLAFVRAVRSCFQGPIALAGGIGDGWALWAAEVLGADLGYLGTRFIAATESLAPDEFKRALAAASLDDIVTTAEPSGLPANFLREWLQAHALTHATGGYEQQRLFAHKNVWSAGHSVFGVGAQLPAEKLIAELADEYAAARQATTTLFAERQ